MSVAQLDIAVADGRLFCVEMDGQLGYPAFFLDPSLNRAQLEAVSQLLRTVAASARWQFFVTPRGSLALPGKTVNGVLTESGVPRTPLQALRDGDLDLVVRAAHGLVGR